MNHIKFTLSFFVAALFFASCSTTYIIGEDFEEEKVEKIELGKTTAAEIVNLFGEPFKKGKVNDYNVYMYSYEETEFPPFMIIEIYLEYRYKTLSLIFDKNNVVQHYSHNLPLTAGFSDILMIVKEIERKQQQNNQSNNNNNMNGMNGFGNNGF